MENSKRIIPAPSGNGRLTALFGKLDENMIKIERAFGVSIINRGDDIAIVGGGNADAAEAVLRKLIKLSEKDGAIDDQAVNYLIASYKDDNFDDIDKLGDDVICMTVTGKPIKAKTIGQRKYIDMMRKNIIVFSVGPAGTGKTYLSMAMAVAALKRGDVNRIILTRPAIEAGEKLGFLPGDLQQKVDPYLRPLHDALFDIMGPESFQKNLEKNVIEVAPLAYMRGRTLDNSFIVLDEAQNTTAEQMKMFLTRIGTGSKVVVTGDVTQIDLPDGKKSGLKEAVLILKDIEGIGISYLSNRDVVRHPLVQKIIGAYERMDARRARRKRDNARGGE